MRPLQLNGHTRPITQVLVNSTGTLLFTAGKDGNLGVWDMQDGNLLGYYKPSIDGKEISKVIWSIDVTLDSLLLIAASAEGVFIFDVGTKEQVFYLCLKSVCRSVQWNTKPAHQNKFVVVRDAFSKVVSAAITIYKLDLETRSVTATLEIINFESKCLGAAWGAYDLTIVSRHENGMIIVWDAETGAKIMERQAHTENVSWMEFSADRSLCLTCSTDATAKLWTTHDWNEIQSFTTDRPLNSCSISPLYSQEESTRRLHVLLAGGQQASEVTTTKIQEGKQEILLVHMVSAELLGLIPGHFSPVNSATFLPDGRGFVTGAEEGFVRIYHFDASYFDASKLA